MDWTPSEPVKVGDRINIAVPPPLTWWDKVLWRLFRIERKRASVPSTFTITSVYPKD